MQNIKDSFFIAIRDRLATLNPQRTVSIQGIENEISAAAPREAGVFYLHWGLSAAASGTERLEKPLIKINCEVFYLTLGSDDLSSQDRGRALATLDRELLSITIPARSALK